MAGESFNALLQAAVARLAVLTGTDTGDLTGASNTRLMQWVVVLVNALESGGGGTVDQTARDAAAAAQSEVDALEQTVANLPEGGTTDQQARDDIAALETKALQFELPFYFTANGAGRYLAVRAVRLATPFAGTTGTFTYERALAATPSTYAAATFPLDMAPGDRFRVTVAGLTTGQDGTVNVLATVL